METNNNNNESIDNLVIQETPREFYDQNEAKKTNFTSDNFVRAIRKNLASTSKFSHFKNTSKFQNQTRHKQNQLSFSNDVSLVKETPTRPVGPSVRASNPFRFQHRKLNPNTGYMFNVTQQEEVNRKYMTIVGANDADQIAQSSRSMFVKNYNLDHYYTRHNNRTSYNNNNSYFNDNDSNKGDKDEDDGLIFKTQNNRSKSKSSKNKINNSNFNERLKDVDLSLNLPQFQKSEGSLKNQKMSKELLKSQHNNHKVANKHTNQEVNIINNVNIKNQGYKDSSDLTNVGMSVNLTDENKNQLDTMNNTPINKEVVQKGHNNINQSNNYQFENITESVNPTQITVNYYRRPVIKKNQIKVEKKYRDYCSSDLDNRNKQLFKNIKITRDLHDFIDLIGITRPVKFK